MKAQLWHTKSGDTYLRIIREIRVVVSWCQQGRERTLVIERRGSFMGVVQERRHAASRSFHDDGSPGPWAGNLVGEVLPIDKYIPLIKSYFVVANCILSGCY